ncbi:hypothetical protein EVAR_30826_1 [Eumeta japonica]|uniref:Uncharacterized protein n=1 Tax=Eumeta variegata TaxID=151549 RepID=A0A4C1XQJ2_EUMVA|nr:hypothetical protein EVAR_30826_1 [Eumeta japonica]
MVSSSTYGFRKAQSRLDCISCLVSEVQQIGFSNGLSTAGCFLDIDNSYNNDSVTSVVLALDTIGAVKKTQIAFAGRLPVANRTMFRVGLYFSAILDENSGSGAAVKTVADKSNDTGFLLSTAGESTDKFIKRVFKSNETTCLTCRGQCAKPSATDVTRTGAGRARGLFEAHAPPWEMKSF